MPLGCERRVAGLVSDDADRVLPAACEREKKMEDL